MCPHASGDEGTTKWKNERQQRQEGACEGMCVIWGLALGERLGVTRNATDGLLEVIVVDANMELIVVQL